MIPAPVGLQLYSIREMLAAGFEAGVRRVAEMGYAGVETAGFPWSTPAAPARLFRELGLEVCSAHSALPLGDKTNEVLDTLATIGTTRLVCPWKPVESFRTIDGVREVCDELNAADEVCRANGLTLLYHNHWQECLPLDGRPAYETMVDLLSPSVLFEVDTYWAKTAGVDPAVMLRRLGARAPLVHLKDGPCTMEGSMTAVGDGVQDWPPVIDAARPYAQWLIVELDRCATDMMEAVEKSCRYVVEKGWGHGRR